MEKIARFIATALAVAIVLPLHVLLAVVVAIRLLAIGRPPPE